MRNYLYIKQDDDLDTLKKLVFDLNNEYEVDMTVFIDSKRNNLVYNQMKSELEEGQVVAIPSLRTLGSDEITVYAELKTLFELDIILIVEEIKTTHNIDFDRNHIAFATIIEMYEMEHSNISSSFQKYQASIVGRKKINYPENWDSLYTKWKNKDISSKEFMDGAGLKKGTFYNLLTEYKELENANSFIDSKEA